MHSVAAEKKSRAAAAAAATPAEGAGASDEEVIDVTVIKFSPEIEERLAIKKGIHITIDKPWKTVPKEQIINVLMEMENFRTARRLKTYSYDEVLVGYQTGVEDSDGHLICLTDKGRQRVLSELGTLHRALTEKVRQYLNRESSKPPLSEKRISASKKERPPITYEWTGHIQPRLEKTHFADSNLPPVYSRILCRNKDDIKLVQSAVQHAHVLATPNVKDCTVQTEPEISINDCTQFVPELDLPTFTGLTPEQEKHLASVCKAYSDTVMEATSYNSLFDLYKDDYSELLQMGEPLTIPKSNNYTHYMSFNDISQFEGKIITSLSWNGENSGAIAAAYGTQSASNMVRLESDSEDENYHTRGNDLDIWAKSRSVLSVSDKDKKERNAWIKTVNRIEQLLAQDYSEDQWKASEMVLDALEKVCRIREFEVQAQKAKEDAIPFRDVGPEEHDIYYIPYEVDVEFDRTRLKAFISEGNN